AREADAVLRHRDRGVARHDRPHRRVPGRAPGQPGREPHPRLLGADAAPAALCPDRGRQRPAHRLDRPAHPRCRNHRDGQPAVPVAVPAPITPEARTTVMGNPPFLGHYTRTSEQAQELREVWERKDIGHLDYVTGWYRKALDFFGTIPGRFAFVSTNSTTQGE